MDFYRAGNVFMMPGSPFELFFTVLETPLEPFLQLQRSCWSHFNGVGDSVGAIFTLQVEVSLE